MIPGVEENNVLVLGLSPQHQQNTRHKPTSNTLVATYVPAPFLQARAVQPVAIVQMDAQDNVSLS